ncbi:MAG: acetylxylan esterase, partial [Bacteroidales bacterium]|nr:acetylxylan esterase [Bacteroidales bacterium]
RGLPEKNIKNITLENITITADNGLIASDAHAIKLNNVNITPRQGPVMSLQDCRNVTIQGSGTQIDCDTFLLLKGEKTGNIRLIDNDLSNVNHEVIMEKEVPAGAVLITQDKMIDEAGISDSFELENLNVLTGNTSTLLLDYLLQELDKHYDTRRKTIEQALISREKLLEYQQELRQKYHKLLGKLPEKTPLNACVTGVIECDGYRIEKVAYESRPNHHVTANLYVPTTGNAPFPGILVPCGHWKNAKTIEEHQSICSLLATNGMVALVVDPISQGERYQLLTADGKPANRGGTLSHSLLDIGANLVGTDIVAYEAWDNIRGIDYLVSRQEVDPEKIGCTGASGGGTQTTFLMALDDRIKAAAPACYICSVESNLKDLGSPDGCQQLAGGNALGIEQISYLTMRAPKPTLIIAAEQDFFPISATRETFKEAQRVYTALGFPDRVAMFTVDAEHGFNKAMREAAVNWMRRWLLKNDRPITEPEFTLHEEKNLWVTTTGQVGSHFPNEVNIADLNLARAVELAQQRQR